MENKVKRPLIHAVLLVIGLALIIGGIITGKQGATVVGIGVAAVNVQQWMNWNKKATGKNKNQVKNHEI